MASYDFRSAAAGTAPYGTAYGTGPSQEQLYADYLRETMASFDAYADAYAGSLAPQSPSRVNYADPPNGLVPGFRRSSDILQLDPDPFGTQTAALGSSLPGSGISSDSVLALDVFGRRMSNDQLRQSDAGRRLLEVAERNRTGRRRGFLDAITDWSWSDAPFLSLFATVGKSVSDAVMVSDTFKKLQNGEPVTDEELIKTRLYMEEQEERRNGTWGATVGDIVRAAPGFMVEFFASGSLYSLARTGLARATGIGAKSAIHLAMTRAEKTLAREATEAAARKAVTKAQAAVAKSAKGVVSDAAGWAELAKDKVASSGVVDEAVETVMKTMKAGKVGANDVLGARILENGAVEFADETAVRQLVRNRVEHEFTKAAVRNSSELGVVNWMHSTGQWLQRHMSAGLLDHGMWSTDEATVLTSGFTKARSALADAAGALFVEAPVRGSLQFLPNQLVARPLLGQVLGQDGRTVSESELSLRQSAYLIGRNDPEAGRRLMEDAESISLGMNWLEYVSENAGRGFGSLARGVGLWIDKGVRPAVRGLAKPAADVAVAAGEKTAENSGFRIGGALRDFWNKRFGSRLDFRRKSLDDQVKVIGGAFRDAGVAVEDSTLRAALIAKSAESLPQAARDMVGANMGKFVEDTMRAAYKTQGDQLAYKTFGRYWVADFMTRHNIGPETLLNLYQRAGYDGVLGEMLEERYADMAKGFFGWNDKTDRDTISRRLSEGIKGIWPGWDQLTAEAAGFAIPMVTRMGFARLQARVGGEGPLAKLRERLEFMSDIFRSGITVRTRIGDYLAVQSDSMRSDRKEVEDAEKERDEAHARGDAQAEAAAAQRLDVAKRRRDVRRDTHRKWLAGMREYQTTRFDADIAAARARGDEAEAGRLAAERDRLASVYTGWESGNMTPADMAREDLDRLVTIKPLSDAAASSEDAAAVMRPADDEAQSDAAMDAYEAFVDFSPELAKMLYQLDAPLEGESRSWLRTVAHKLVGIAGFAITGDMSLASADPASWAARDMGVSSEFLKSIKEVYRGALKQAQSELLEKRQRDAVGRRRTAKEETEAELTATRAEPAPEGYEDSLGAEVQMTPTAREAREIRDRHRVPYVQGETFSVTEREIEDRAQQIVANQVRRMAQAYLAAQQVRSFSQREMRDQALMLVARDKNRVEGGAYDVVDPDNRMLYRLAADGTVDESTGISFDRFYEQNRDDVKRGAVTHRGVDSRASEIGRATLDMLANRTNVGVGAGGIHQLVELPDDADFRKLMVYTAAMRLSGFRGMITTQRIRGDRTLEQTMRDSASFRVSQPVMSAVAKAAMNPDGTFDATRVDPRLTESVAQGLGLQFDGTAKGLEERNAKVAELCIYADSMSRDDVQFISVREAMPEGDERLGDGRTVLLRAVYRDGRWTCSESYVPVKEKGKPDGDGKTYEAGTVAGLIRKLKDDGYDARKANAQVLFTQARVLASDDLADMIRVTGLTRTYVSMMRELHDESYVHPLFRKNADGSWMYSETEADEALERELALAARYDGKHLVDAPREGMTAAELAAEERRAKAAWTHVYGTDGYVTVGERLLRSHQVDTVGTVNLATGRAQSAGRYQVMLSQFIGRTGDVYVPIDLTRSADLRESMVGARLMQGYATNPRLVANAFDGGIEAFLRELDALTSVEIAKARREGNDFLAGALRDFRKTVTQRAARFVRVEDGRDENGRPRYRRVRRDGYGLSPNAFVQMAHAFCCFGAERLERDGYGRTARSAAISALKDGARRLPHFYSLFSLTDVLLGGSGFLGERVRPEGRPATTHLGLAGLVRTYFNDGEAVRRLVSGMTPGGVDFGAFLEAADHELGKLGKPGIVVDYGGVREQDGGRRAPSSVGELGDVIRSLKQATGLTDNGEFARFVERAVEFAQKATGNQPTELDNAIRRLSSLHDAGVTLDNAEAMIRDARVRLAEVSGRWQDAIRQRDLLLRAGTPDPARRAAAERLVSELSKQVADASMEVDEWARTHRSAQESLAALQSAMKAGDVQTEGGRENGDGEGDGYGAASPEDDLDLDMEDTSDAVGGLFQELPPFETNAMYSGADTLADRVASAEDALVGTGLTEKEARAAFAVAASAASAAGNMHRHAVREVVDRMFPGLPENERLQVMSFYDTFVAHNPAPGEKQWAALVREGLAWTYLEEDKDENEGADTASEDRKADRAAVDELTGEGLRTFLKLARFAAPETGANLQAFLDGRRTAALRGAAEADAGGAAGFMKDLLCPRERTEFDGVRLDTANKRDAVFDALVLKRLADGTVAAGYVKELMAAGRVRDAFLVSYLAAMADADRARFAQLIGSATGCDALKLTPSGRMRQANPQTKRLSQATAAALLTPYAGFRRDTVMQAAEALRKAFTASEKTAGFAAANDKFETYDRNRHAIADALVESRVFREDDVIVQVLRSDSTAAFLKTRLAMEEGSGAKPYHRYVSALADAMSWREETYVGRPGAHFEIPLIMPLVTALTSLSVGEAGSRVTYADAEAAATVAVTSGDARKDSPVMSERSSHYDNPLATLLTLHASAQPVTIMTADVDRRRSNKDSTVAVTSRGTVPILTRWLDSKAFRDLLKASQGVQDEALLDAMAARCRQTMKWPDGTRILAKNISVSYHSDEIYDACRETYVSDVSKMLVPLYAGDHASSVIVQVPPSVADSMAGSLGLPAAAEADPAKEAARRGGAFDGVSLALCKSIGVELLGDDTKRSAVTSLEQAGTSMVGVRRGPDGAPEFGHCDIHIVYSAKSRRNAREAKDGAMGNEELKGTTMMFGYGAERQRRCAKLQGTGTLKCHLISTWGRDLLFLKSLSVCPLDARGEFLDSDYKAALYRHLQSAVGSRADIDTAVLTDFDSYKVGPASSKWLQINDNGTRKGVLEYVIDRLEAAMEAGGGKIPADRTLDEIVGNIGDIIEEAPRSDGLEFPKGKELHVSDVLPGLRVSEIKVGEDTVLDFTYRDDGLTAYSVANVSHKATVESLRMPRNHMVDILAMTRAERGLLADGDPRRDVLDDIESLVRDWGFAASAVCGNPDVIASLMVTSPGIRDMLMRGEHPDGQALREELFRTAWAQMRRQLNLPVNAIDCPLVSAGCGASVLRDGNGNILYDEHTGRPRITSLSGSKMAEDLNVGSVVFTQREADEVYGGFRRRLALAAVNVRHRGFRYGWWMDEGAFRSAYKLDAGASERQILDRLDEELTAIHRSELSGGKVDVDARKKLLACFMDHAGMHISEYGDRDIRSVMFDDLFMCGPKSGGRVFDRSAVQIDGDKVHLDADGQAHIFLGGTAFGIPRTPSYNGGPWLQVARASVPVDVIAPEAAAKKRRENPGLDAMVAPDPVTNEILGSDHDGDKTKVYMITGAGIGEYLDDIPSVEDVTGFGRDPKVREGHYRRLLDEGFVDEPVDGRTGQKVRTMSDKVRRRAGNRVARDLFDMAHMLPVPDETEGGPRRRSFLGGVASMPMRAFPGSDGTKRELLGMESRRPGARRAIAEGHRLDEPNLAADVSAKANDAADARARIVSLARALHLAYATGWYANGRGSLFGNGMTSGQWMRFMHIVDGLSNATFDDIKEQLCSRLGWTSGMMKIVVADLMLNRAGDGTYGQRAVQTDEEARQALLQYVDSVNNYGSRYYMMVSSDEADREGFAEARRAVGGRGWATTFGVSSSETVGENGERIVTWGPTGGSLPPPSAEMTPGAAVRQVVGDAVKALNEGRGPGLQMSESEAYRAFAYSGRAADPMHGYLFWLLSRAAGVEATGDLQGMAKAIGQAKVDMTDKGAVDRLTGDVKEFLLLYEKASRIEHVNSMGQAFNYVGADPGAEYADSRNVRLDELAGEAVRDAGGRDDPFLPMFNAMNAVTRSVYNMGYQLETVAVRAAHAVRDFGRNLGALAEVAFASDGALKDGELAGILADMGTLDQVSDAGTAALVRRANAQTVPFVVAALQDARDAVRRRTGDGTVSCRDVLKMLKTIGDVYKKETPTVKGTSKEDERWLVSSGWMTDTPAPAGAVSAKATPRGDLFRMLKGVNTLFEVMYRLVTSSTEHFDLRKGNAAFGYFQSRGDTKFATVKDDVTNDVLVRYEDADGLFQLMPRMLGSSDQLNEHAKGLVARILAGESFAGRRVKRNAAKGAAYARSFVLSKENLAAFESEVLALRKGSGDAQRLIDDIRTAKAIVERIGDVTPQRMFGELLPVCTAMTSRTEGAPSVGSPSLLTLLPGVYERWSSRAVANDRRARALVDALIACVFAPVETVATSRAERKARPEAAAEPETPDDTGEDPSPAAPEPDAAKAPEPPHEVRVNPEYRSYVDVFAADGLLARAADWLGGDVDAGRPTDPRIRRAEQAGQDAAAGRVDGEGRTGEYDESKATEVTKRTAAALRALCGKWAKVRITGDHTITVEGNLRGGFTTGAPTEARAVLLISTSGDAMDVNDERHVQALAGSRSFAASLVNQAPELGIRSVTDFFRLPFDVRVALARRYGLGGATLNRAVKYVDGRGMAVLVGAIKLPGGKATTALYHEYFHGMMTFFNALGMFGPEDVKMLRKTFGDPPAGSGALFNEERAAERFRRWVEKGTEKDPVARGFFGRLFAEIARLFRALVNGFRYTGERGRDGEFSFDEEALFSMAVHGVVGRSLDARASNEHGGVPSALAARITASRPRELVSRLDPATGERRLGVRRRGEKVDGKTVQWASREDAERVAKEHLTGVLRGVRGTHVPQDISDGLAVPEDAPKVKAILEALGPGSQADGAMIGARITELLDAVRPRAADPGVREYAAGIVEGADPITLLDTVPTQPEDASFALNLGAPPVGAVHATWRAGRTLAEMIAPGVTAEFSADDIKRLHSVDPAVYARTGGAKLQAVVRNGVRDAMAALDPGHARADIGDAAFEVGLCLHQGLSRMQIQDRRAPDRYLEALGSDDVARARLKEDASTYDVSAAIMAAGGVMPADQLADARDRLTELAKGCGDRGKALIARCAGALSDAWAAVDGPEAFVDELKGRTKALERAIEKVQPGLRFGGFDAATGEPGEYWAANPETTDNGQSAVNAPVYSVLNDAEGAERAALQAAVHTTLSTLYRCLASLKYHRELGFVPATPEDIDRARELQGRIASPKPAGEWFAEQAIGNSNLVDNEGLVDYYDQPYFVAENMEQWLSAAVRPSFGGAPFGDAVRQEHHEYAGLIYGMKDLENWQAFLLGDSVEAGSPILAPILRDRNFEMVDGAVTFRKTGDKLLGFDNYGRLTSSITLTEDELALVDWWKKSLSAYMGGRKRMITGVDRIWFTDRDASGRSVRGDDPWTREAIRRKFDSLDEEDRLTRFEITLLRMQHQIPEAVLGDGGMNLYARFTQAAREALSRAAERRRALADAVRRDRATPDERREYEAFDLNSRVLDELEAKGFVVCRRDGSGRATEAVLTVDVDEVDDAFRKSTAYGKLVSDERWRRTGWDRAKREAALSREAIVAPWRDQWAKLSRFVREHPWMTDGDARFMTAFGTPVPYFRGTGLFMHNAIRASREDRRTRSRVDALGRNERMFLWACTAENRGFAVSDPAHHDEVMTLVDILHDVGGFGSLQGEGLLRALIDGDLAPGGRYADLAARCGVRFGKDPSVAEISDAIYGFIVDRAYAEARGIRWNAREARTVDALIEIYEDRALGDGEFTGMMGASPEMMYRAHGFLPANHQLGHLVRVASEGVTNAMAHRATFMTLMLTPSADGAPVYYMRPDPHAAERSGIPDACWGQIARWWAAFHHLGYDETKTGVENARALYDHIRDTGTDRSNGGGSRWRLKQGDSDHRYIPLADDHDLVSVSGIMCMEDEDVGSGSSALNALAQGEAAGYMKQFVNAGRSLGWAAPRAGLHRMLSWSKSMSVSFSLFFPLATRFESPIGAVGAIPTVVGNAGPGFLRAHPEIFNGLQKVFGGSGWITKDFIGFNDILRMMDSRDPFLAEMVSWAHALGVTISDSLVNPMEPTKSIVASDIADLKRVVRGFGWGEKVNARFSSLLDALFVRSGDRAFNYALNATKLAVVAQLAMKLRHEAQRRGKAFDPIRDLRRYAGYINAEVGGIDETRYAWAHPWLRGMLNCLFFSWQWTRGAWEAGGGTVIEDIIFGGHSATREERQILLGRWARMYGEVMIGVPMLMQAVVLMLAKAMGGGDDDDDRWFTWQNESKVGMSAFDITPLMKAIHRHEDVAGIAGRIAGAAVGALKFGPLGSVAGLAFGDRLVPDYTGRDQANQTTRNRRYYMHFGKQGWEFFRWFDAPGQQFMGKLSMPTQRFLEGAYGRNLGYLERKLPWEGMGPVERWLSLDPDSATVNLAKAFFSFAVGQMMSFGDAGFLPIVGPVQMGASQTAIQKRLEEAIGKWAENDRAAYSWGARRPGAGKKAVALAGRFSDILADAERNGLDPETQLNTALGTVARNYYGRLFALLPDEPDGDYDVRAVERVCRALNRIVTKQSSVLQSAKKKLERQGRPLDKMDPEMRMRLERIIGRHMADPFAGEMEPAAEPPTREEY